MTQPVSMSASLSASLEVNCFACLGRKQQAENSDDSVAVFASLFCRWLSPNVRFVYRAPRLINSAPLFHFASAVFFFYSFRLPHEAAGRQQLFFRNPTYSTSEFLLSQHSIQTFFYHFAGLQIVSQLTAM